MIYGTPAAYQAHYHDGTSYCATCREASSRAGERYRAARQAILTRALGTRHAIPYDGIISVTDAARRERSE